jgi:hypothetical protein
VCVLPGSGKTTGVLAEALSDRAVPNSNSNSQNQNLQFTGKFKQNASIDEICNVINTALKINLTRKSAK